ncbi:Acyl carrier protein 3- mitochondrial [Striga hermonthica]|uniref:Acyl carrier protein n=1 Tax=Striga hermonthica TaxID=68872 RepID=A0A9N7NSM7_STRHE|nr:Acyl carrier protein 3- mitochondrial [Striga hermonthica]
MQNLRKAILGHLRIGGPVRGHLRAFSAAADINQDRVMGRVIELVKKFDKINAAKVTEKADFQKDLSLDSLDRVELVMAFEEEFSVEIPDSEADKLKCCADVAKYVISSSNGKVFDSSS